MTRAGRIVRVFVVSILIGALAALAGCSSGSNAKSAAATTSSSSPTSSPSTAPASGSGEPGVFGDIPDVVKNVQPTVVTIEAGNGLGSGVIYRSDGYIITNDHVVAAARSGRVQVDFADGKQTPGHVVAGDKITDIAVVKVSRTGLPHARFVKKLPEVGSLAVAIGSPLGFNESATAGIVSGLHRDIPGSFQSGSPQLVDLIQTDAAISPGNSGGALADSHGRVVGITSAYLPPNPPQGRGAVSIGFAIPAATADNIAKQLIANGKAVHSFLGVVPVDLTPQIAGQLGVRGVQAGALVQGVDPGSPADKAGIKPGDVITGLGGAAIGSAEDLSSELRNHKPGDSVKITLVRGGKKQTVTATLIERPS